MVNNDNPSTIIENIMVMDFPGNVVQKILTRYPLKNIRVVKLVSTWDLDSHT